MNTAEKNQQVEEFGEAFGASVASFLVGYQGTKCAELTKLRRQLRPAGARVRIIKNTLARRALKGSEGEKLEGLLTGPTAVVWSKSDPVAPAKIIADFTKEVESFKVKGGLVDGKVVTAADVGELAKLPSREELLSKLLALINAPASRLLQTINAPGSRLVQTLEAWRQKQEEGQSSSSA